MSVFLCEFKSIRLEVQQNLLDSLHVAADSVVAKAFKHCIEFNF